VLKIKLGSNLFTKLNPVVQRLKLLIPEEPSGNQDMYSLVRKEA
jgi:hypothetical protein